MENNFKLVTCPTCQGFGLVSQAGGTLTCQACEGRGQWVEDASGKKLTYALPEVAPVKNGRKISPKVFLVLGLLLAAGLFQRAPVQYRGNTRDHCKPNGSTLAHKGMSYLLDKFKTRNSNVLKDLNFEL